MRLTGTSAHGVRLPIISQGDHLPSITAQAVADAVQAGIITLKSTDIIGVTESIVAKAQGNFVSTDDVAKDVRAKFPGGTVGVVFPIFSRNRFVNILKGIAKGADKVYVLLNCPTDEVGNPIMDLDDIDRIMPALADGPIPAAKFRELSNNFLHPFTFMDYMDLYEKASDNIEVFVSNDPRNILKLTDTVIAAEIHTRFRTKKRLEAAGAKMVYTLSDIMTKPIDGSGYNEQYGILGSNLSTENRLKLFPRDCEAFVVQTRAEILAKTGIEPEVLVYGDGAFKDPICGIWELADPVVSPAYTERLGGQPSEIKLKYVADNMFSHLSGEEKTKAVADMIKAKESGKATFSEGTTPRKYADLLGSLCDLISGSGDKGTPVILIQGYFDDYAAE